MPICRPSRKVTGAKTAFDFAPDDKLLACKRCGAQIGDNGGLLTGGQVGAAGHAANEMWPFVAGVLCGRWKAMAFEAAGDKELSAGCEHVGISVIAPGIRNQGGRDFGWSCQIRATNDK